jgi:hypothetical protein
MCQFRHFRHVLTAFSLRALRLGATARSIVALTLLAAQVVGFASIGHAGDVFINKEFPIRGANGAVELSPPNIEATNECSSHVYVDSFIPKATIRVYLGGTTLIGGAVTPATGFVAVALTHQLHTGDKVTATQTVNGVTSAPSGDALIGVLPDNLPQPRIDPTIYACGRVVPVHNLLSGVTVDVKDTTTNTTLGSSFTPNNWGSDWSPVGTSTLTAAHKLTATATACGGTKTSVASVAQSVKSDPAPMTKPMVSQPIVGNDAISINGLYDGALVRADNTAVNPAANLGEGYATAPSNLLELAAPLTAAEHVAVKESLCADTATTPAQTPVATLEAPILLGPICPGQAAVEVRGSTPNATLVLLRNGAVAGYGGAAPGDVPLTIAPSQAFAINDTVEVLQYINAITSPKSNNVKVGCTNVVTYHYNVERTGWDEAEQVLTPATVGSKAFGLLQTVPLDDQSDAQPLIVTQQTIAGVGKRDVVYVATENNTVYAIDVLTGGVLLSPNFGAPVPKSALPGSCGNNGNNIGINSTPVIDISAGVMYVIIYTYEKNTPVFRIHELSLDDLTDKIPPVEIKASHTLSDGTTYSFRPQNARQRSALLEANGNVYAGFASFCDIDANTSRGWLLGWKAGSLTPLASNELTITQTNAQTPSGGLHDFFLSSIWMSGYGVAADSSGSLYFVTGNSSSVRTDNIQESAVRISSDLSAVKDSFTPANFAALDQADTDFGSGGLMVLPDQPGPVPHLAVAAGKDGRLFILNRDNMGGFVSGGPDKAQNVNIQSCWCGQSYFVGSDGVGRVVSSGGTAVNTWKVNTSSPVALSAEGKSASIFNTDTQDPGFFTTISSNGTQANSGVIWAVSRPDADSGSDVSLYAFDATASGTALTTLHAGIVAGTWPNTGGNANIVPVVANGKVYVATFKQLAIFGLSPTIQTGRKAIEPRSLEAPVAAAEPAVSGTRIYGTIASVSDSRVVVQLRNGKTLTVELAGALKAFHTVIPYVGEPVVVNGVTASDGTIEAQSMLRVKGPASWGPDSP